MTDSTYTILHIEDDAATRLLVKKILTEAGFQYVSAATGIEGLEKLKKHHPDLILMDLKLPDISGVELTTKIKNLPNFKHIPIVALTGMKRENIREMSLIAGCDGYLTKPIDSTKFPEQILQFIKGKRDVIESTRLADLHLQYEAQLVDQLTVKIQELQHSNQLLKARTSTLRQYSEKLEKILEVIQQLQSVNTPAKLVERLVDSIHTIFDFDRCIFLGVDFEQMALQVRYATGLASREWPKLTYPYRPSFFQKLFRNKQVIYISSLDKVADPHLRKMLEEFETNQFVFAILGVSESPDKKIFDEDQAVNLGESSPVSFSDDAAEFNFQLIEEHLREYLSSEMFYIGGYLFADRKASRKKIESYNIRLLEMLLRNASLIYQNLQLREQLKQLFIRAERDAITDHLTNLFNYRYFTQQLMREVFRAQRHKSQFALLMLDIDWFKIYNDTFGHQAGDIVLKKLAQILKENTRSSDIVARYGGEEFVIICPELDKTGALKLAEKLRKIIESTHFPQQEKLPFRNVTISIGVAAYPEDATTPHELIRKADIALYEAKRKGRNRVIPFQAETHVN